jgi:hypothetical protein
VSAGAATRRWCGCLLAAAVLTGCGDRAAEPARHVPPVRLSHSTIDRALEESGVDAQLIQSLSETAQSVGYDRDRYALTSWRSSQDLALVALRRCRADRAGRRHFPQYVADDVRRGIDRTAALRVNRFMEQEFCVALTG